MHVTRRQGKWESGGQGDAGGCAEPEPTPVPAPRHREARLRALGSGPAWSHPPEPAFSRPLLPARRPAGSPEPTVPTALAKVRNSHPSGLSALLPDKPSTPAEPGCCLKKKKKARWQPGVVTRSQPRPWPCPKRRSATLSLSACLRSVWRIPGGRYFFARKERRRWDDQEGKGRG